MNNIYKFVFVLISVLAVDNVIADCTGTKITNPDVSVVGNMITGSYNGDSWQEVHCNGGRLWDLKQGIGHPVDPSGFVGNWGINNNNLVHTYDGTSYEYELIRKSGGGYCLKGVTPNTPPFVDINIVVPAPSPNCN
jgi:hypothetical protein